MPICSCPKTGRDQVKIRGHSRGYGQGFLRGDVPVFGAARRVAAKMLAGGVKRLAGRPRYLAATFAWPDEHFPEATNRYLFR
jgi:hypothetical protein